MSNYNNKGGDRGGSRGGFNDRNGGRTGDRGGNRSFGAPTMHKANCDGCGKTAELPFKPTGDKPVFCSDCFNSKKGGDDRRSGDRRDSRAGGGRDFRGGDRKNDRDRRSSADMSGVMQKIDVLHAKIDKVLEHIGAPKEQEKAFESDTVFRAAKKEVAPKKPKVKKPKAGDLKKAVAKAATPKVSKSVAKKATKKVVKKVAKKKAVKKVAKKKKE